MVIGIVDHDGVGRRRRDGLHSPGTEDVSEATCPCDRRGRSRLRVDSDAKCRNRTLSGALESDAERLVRFRRTERFGRAECRIYRVCWLSLPAAGWFGFGPGTFSIVFPFLLAGARGRTQRHTAIRPSGLFANRPRMGNCRIRSFGQYWLGAGSFASLSTFGEARWQSRASMRCGLALTALSIFGVLIHSLVDFPLQIASLQLITAVLLGQLWVKLPRHQVLPQPRRGARRMPGVRVQQG